MSGVIKFTEAASLALHAMALLASERDRRFLIDDVADALPVSRAHLAKVLQRLARAGLIASTRGRGGGFQLARDPARTTLLDVYEAVEGRLEVCECMFAEPQCRGDCILGDALGVASGIVRDRLARTRLSELDTRFERRARQRAAKARAGRRANT